VKRTSAFVAMERAIRVLKRVQVQWNWIQMIKVSLVQQHLG